MKTCNCKMVTPLRKKNYSSGASSIGKLPIYGLYCKIKHRCRRGNRYETNYADRGIKICERWLYSYESFVSDIGPRPSSLHSVDRKNNDLGYCPHNCIWATKYEQILSGRVNVRKGSLPRWVSITKDQTFVVKRSVKGRMIHGGTFKTVKDATRAAREIGKI